MTINNPAIIELRDCVQQILDLDDGGADVIQAVELWLAAQGAPLRPARLSGRVPHVESFPENFASPVVHLHVPVGIVVHVVHEAEEEDGEATIIHDPGGSVPFRPEYGDPDPADLEDQPARTPLGEVYP